MLASIRRAYNNSLYMAETNPPITDRLSFLASIADGHDRIIAAQGTRDLAEHNLHVASERLDEAEQNFDAALKNTAVVGKLVRFISGTTVEVDAPDAGRNEWPTPLKVDLEGVVGIVVGHSMRDGKPNPVIQFMVEGPKDEFFDKLPLPRKSIFGFDPTEPNCDFELYEIPQST